MGARILAASIAWKRWFQPAQMLHMAFGRDFSVRQNRKS